MLHLELSPRALARVARQVAFVSRRSTRLRRCWKPCVLRESSLGGGVGARGDVGRSGVLESTVDGSRGGQQGVSVSAVEAGKSSSASGSPVRKRQRRRDVQLPGELRSRRYDPEFWGCAGGRRAPGRNGHSVKISDVERRQNVVDNVRCPDRCRKLLMDLDDEVIGYRLEKSRYNLGGSNAFRGLPVSQGDCLDDNWLEEALAAFSLSTKCARGGRVQNRPGHMRQSDAVAAVLVSVRVLRSERDGDRGGARC